MKTTTSLILSLVLILAPVLAVGKRTEGMTQQEFDAKCKAEGGCFVVTENGFKKAMVMSFVKGQEFGRAQCKDSI